MIIRSIIRVGMDVMDIGLKSACTFGEETFCTGMIYAVFHCLRTDVAAKRQNRWGVVYRKQELQVAGTMLEVGLALWLCSKGSRGPKTLATHLQSLHNIRSRQLMQWCLV